MIEKEALEMYEKRPAITKTTHKEISKNGQVTIIEETNTEEVADMTIWLLELILKVQSLRIKHTHGDNINISAALLSAEIQDAKDNLEKAIKDNKTPIVDVLELAKMKKILSDSEDRQ